MEKQIRKPEVVVISDFHLATHACKAKELLKYLKSILPKKLILNGDIIDAWRFSRNYFPKSHLKVIRQIIKMMEKGTEVIYVTGNHDEVLRKFENTSIGRLKIVNQVKLDMNNEKTWIFHGDILDSLIHKTKRLAKFGAALYGLVTIINKGINSILKVANIDSIILYKQVKKLFLRKKEDANSFEKRLAHLAWQKGVSTVICGHTHIPTDKIIQHEGKRVRYINCGDWVENFTTVEYSNEEWTLIDCSALKSEEKDSEEILIPNQKELYEKIFMQIIFSN